MVGVGQDEVTGVTMKVGMVGCGKLGLPVMLAMEMRGHDVMGCDVSPSRMCKTHYPHRERGPEGEPTIEPLLQNSQLRFGTLEEVVKHAEVLFASVQTPHLPEFEGATPLPRERKDFNYSYLIQAMREISEVATRLRKRVPVLVISTVLPGTMRSKVLPVVDTEWVKVCYNPFFIAMGTTMEDFLNPEFVLFGVEDPWAHEMGIKFYETITDAPILDMSIESAEAAKVAYNTFITSKITIINAWMEICHKIPGADVDDVTRVLTTATRRVVSPAYLRGGMGDGGGCHPRDNIALSWLAGELNLSYDIFGSLMTAREKQTEWLADLMVDTAHGLPLVILGKAFKKGTNLTTGSAAVLLQIILTNRGCTVQAYDPEVDPSPCPTFPPSLFLIGTNHEVWHQFPFPSGSVVLDPWGEYAEVVGCTGVTYISVGRSRAFFPHHSNA